MSDELAQLLRLQDGLVTRAQALRSMTPRALHHRVASGRWALVHRGIYVAHSGPIGGTQREWIAVLATGRGRHAVLAGLSALARFGFRGYPDPKVHVLLPARYRDADPPHGVEVHRTSRLPSVDVHTLGRPPCTMPARSLVDAAAWAPDDDRARAIIAAGYQQRLVTGEEVARVLDGMPVVRRRALIRIAARDAADGSHSISELDFLNLCRRAGLPLPARQAVRTDEAGRRRYRDAYFHPWGVHVEIDGGQHMEVSAWWADMKRQNEIWTRGDRVLRFPAWAVRTRPAEVAAQVRAALVAAGWPGGRA